WVDQSTGEQSYSVERKTGAGGTYAEIASIAANSSGYTDSTVAPGTNYFYRVRSYGGGSTYGPYGSEVSATTYASIPTGLAASDGTYSTQIHLSWNTAAGAVSYQIYRGTVNDPQHAAHLAPSSVTSYD